MCQKHERQIKETAVSCAPTELAEDGQTARWNELAKLQEVEKTYELILAARFADDKVL